MIDSKSSFEIQDAGLSDLGALRRLEHACFGGDAWPLIDLVGVLILPSLVRLKVDANGEMAGFIGGDPHRSENVGWIATLGILPEYRRQGLARLLLRQCEERMNLPVIKLSVRRSNDAAQRLYFSEGYHMVDVWKKYYFDGEDALVLEKSR